MQVQIGKIVNTQGLKGEVRVLSNSDFKELRFKPQNKLIAKLRDRELTLVIESWYRHKTFDIIKFEGYDNINDVEFLKNANIYAEKLRDDELETDEFLNSSLLGLNIVDQEANNRGIVCEVIVSPADNVLRVDYNDSQYLIPFNKHFVTKVELSSKTIYVNLLDGLIDES